ncbi:hypothetical protein M0804_006578 [Polistes exclamans]|nr:hypothetical protein M0804_006578 [Polistes exclamans]
MFRHCRNNESNVIQRRMCVRCKCTNTRQKTVQGSKVNIAIVFGILSQIPGTWRVAPATPTLRSHRCSWWDVSWR